MITTRNGVLAITAAAFFTLAGCASPKPEPREYRNRFDLDGDGYLTRKEYSASSLSGAMSFDTLDEDGDGLLSRRELDFRVGAGSRGRGPRGGNRPDTD